MFDEAADEAASLLIRGTGRFQGGRAQQGRMRSIPCLMLGSPNEVAAMQCAQPAVSKADGFRHLIGNLGFFLIPFLCLFLLHLGCRGIPAQGFRPLTRFRWRDHLG